MGWKPAAQLQDHHNIRPTSNQELTELPAPEQRLRNIYKRRNALTVCTLRDDILRRLESSFGQQRQREWRRN